VFVCVCVCVWCVCVCVCLRHSAESLISHLFVYSSKLVEQNSLLGYTRGNFGALRVVTPEAIAALEATVKENRHVTVYEIAAHKDMSDGSAHHIVRDVLLFHKVSARWVPRQLTAELKERRVDVCQELLKRFEAKVVAF